MEEPSQIKGLFKRVAKHVCCALIAIQCAMIAAPLAAEAKKLTPLSPTVSQMIQNGTAFRIESKDPKCNRNLVVVNGAELDEGENTSMTNAIALPVLNEHANLYVMGNAQNGTSAEELSSALQDADKNNLPTTIVINAHGAVRDGKHKILFDSKSSTIPTADVFKQISQNTMKPVSVVLVSCEGGGALDNVGDLPNGSNLTVFTTKREALDDVHLRNLLCKISQEIENNTTQNDPFSGENIYRAYILSKSAKSVEKFDPPGFLEEVKKDISIKEFAEASFGSPAFCQKGQKPVTLDDAKAYLQDGLISKAAINKAIKASGGLLKADQVQKDMAVFEKTGFTANQVALVSALALQERLKNGPGPLAELKYNIGAPKVRAAAMDLAEKAFGRYMSHNGPNGP